MAFLNFNFDRFSFNLTEHPTPIDEFLTIKHPDSADGRTFFLDTFRPLRQPRQRLGVDENGVLKVDSEVVPAISGS